MLDYDPIEKTPALVYEGKGVTHVMTNASLLDLDVGPDTKKI